MYRVVALHDGTFAVEVLIPETFPTLVTGIKSQDAAEAWIARHKATTSSSPSIKRRRFREPLNSTKRPPR
jgi:hypothetical protein